MKTKLTKKEICLSIITTLISFTVLMGVMMLMTVIYFKTINKKVHYQ